MELFDFLWYILHLPPLNNLPDIHPGFQVADEAVITCDEGRVRCFVSGRYNLQTQSFESRNKWFHLFLSIPTTHAESHRSLADEGLPRQLMVRLLIQHEVTVIWIHRKIDLL